VRSEEEGQDLVLTACGYFASYGPPVPHVQAEIRASLEQEPQRVYHARVRRALRCGAQLRGSDRLRRGVELLIWDGVLDVQ
jgi:hypothetical protein